nr:AUGMIN subunit 8 [Ipomoea trifida]
MTPTQPPIPFSIPFGSLSDVSLLHTARRGGEDRLWSLEAADWRGPTATKWRRRAATGYDEAATDRRGGSDRRRLGELSYLDEWASIERDHTSSLLQAITGGTMGDIETVKAAMCSAVDNLI